MFIKVVLRAVKPRGPMASWVQTPPRIAHLEGVSLEPVSTGAESALLKVALEGCLLNPRLFLQCCVDQSLGHQRDGMPSVLRWEVAKQVTPSWSRCHGSRDLNRGELQDGPQSAVPIFPDWVKISYNTPKVCRTLVEKSSHHSSITETNGHWPEVSVTYSSAAPVTFLHCDGRAENS